ncbi:MAG TPA: hypothetical protein VHG52_13645, partial [Thermomicrobiales bacterium]|nr:hypothetical protein [Thermomicrobiales bacterium]
MAESAAVKVDARRVSLPSGAPPLYTDMPPWLGHDGSYAIAELDVDAPRGPWAVIEASTGRAHIGRRLPQIWGALLDADGPPLLGTSGGVIEVALSGPSIVRELREGVGRGPDDAETDFLRLGERHVLLGAVGKQTAKLLDLDRWAVARSQLPVSPPWVALGGSPRRVWSLPRGEVVTLDASYKITERRAAPAAIAATGSASALFALVGRLHPHRGTGWVHALGRDVLPSRLRQRLSSPLDDVELCRLDPQTLRVRARRALGGLAKVVEAGLGTVLSDHERWTTAMMHRCFTTDSVGRPILLAGDRLVVLDQETLDPTIDTGLADDRSVHNWTSRNGLS